MDKKVEFSKKIVYITVLVSVLVSLIIIPYNYYISSGQLVHSIEQTYFLNVVVANSVLSFENIKQILESVFLLKDLFLSISVVIFQGLFFVSMYFFNRNKQSIVLYNLSLSFHLLSYAGTVGCIYVYNLATSVSTVMSIQNYSILGILITQSVIFLYYTILLVTGKLDKLTPLSEKNFYYIVYNGIKVVGSFVLMWMVLILGMTFLIEKGMLAGLDYFINARIAEYIPDILTIDLLPTIKLVPDVLQQFVLSFNYKTVFFEIQSGVFFVSVSTLIANANRVITEYINHLYLTFSMPILYASSYYVGMLLLNYLHKKLNYIYMSIPSVMVVVSVVVSFYYKSSQIVLWANSMLIVFSILYCFLFMDKKYKNYEYTMNVGNFLSRSKRIKDESEVE